MDGLIFPRISICDYSNAPCGIQLDLDAIEYFLTMGKTFTAEVSHQGTVHTVEVPDDRPILDVLQEAGLELPFSCSAGVCTTCAALVTEGTVNQEDGMGVSPELQADGYALLCVAFATSDLKLETEKEEEVYARQFGQP